MAFQVGPFQNGVSFAYQQEVGAAQGAGRHRKRYLVEIDGRDFEVGSAAEALHLLERARDLAKQTAVKAAQAVLRRKVRSQRRPEIRLRKPEIRTNAPISAQVSEIRQEIAAIYDNAARDAEIAYLFMRLLKEEQDEEDALILLLS